MNFTILIGLTIILLGIFFRILPYDSVQGLWNDEYMSWFISQKPLLIEFIKGIAAQCHMPFYYIYLKIITLIFGSSDVALRLSSFVTGFLSILVMYFVGSEKDKKIGALCALFTAVSGFLIYYSYEVRPYSLIFLLSAISLLYSIKLLNVTTKKNLIIYIISNILILLTHTIGFVYVLANLLFVGHYLNKKSQKYTKTLFILCGFCFLALTPFVIKIFTTISFSQWWSNFSVSKLFFMFTDFFSNYLVNLINAPQNFLGAIGWGFFILGIIPAAIGIAGVINSLFIEKSYTKSLFIVALVTTGILFAASLLGKIVFLTKYNIEIYPILIYLSMLGLSSIENKKLKISLLISLFIINIFTLFTDNFKTKFYKPESHKLVAELITNAHLKNGDSILFTYYPADRFDKYIDISKFHTYEIQKGNFNYYMTPDTSYKNAVLNSKILYKSVYMSNNNDNFDKLFHREVLDKIKSGDKLAIIFLDSVEMLSDVQIFSIAVNENIYKKTPQMFLIFSYIKNRSLKLATKELKFLRYEQNGDWSAAVFEKP